MPEIMEDHAPDSPLCLQTPEAPSEAFWDPLDLDVLQMPTPGSFSACPQWQLQLELR